MLEDQNQKEMKLSPWARHEGCWERRSRSSSDEDEDHRQRNEKKRPWRRALFFVFFFSECV